MMFIKGSDNKPLRRNIETRICKEAECLKVWMITML